MVIFNSKTVRLPDFIGISQPSLFVLPRHEPPAAESVEARPHPLLSARKVGEMEVSIEIYHLGGFLK